MDCQNPFVSFAQESRMSLVNPFRALRPQGSVAEEIICPPYDVLNRDEALIRAKGKPLSFLHVSKPEIDLDSAIDPHSEIVYQTGAKSFQSLIKSKDLQLDDSSCLYIYRLQSGDHVQTGLVSVFAIEDYLNNKIRPHEHTRPDKEKDRVDHMLALNAQTGPVMMVCRKDDMIQKLVQKLTQGKSDINVKADDGVMHSLWVINDAASINKLTSVFDTLDTLYIADGHHRTAAAARSAEEKTPAQ